MQWVWVEHRQNKSPRPQLPASYDGSRKTPAVGKSISSPPLCPSTHATEAITGPPHPFTALCLCSRHSLCLKFSSCLVSASQGSLQMSVPLRSSSISNKKSWASFPSSLPPWALAALWAWAAHVDYDFLCLPLDSVLSPGPGLQEGLRQGLGV